MNPETQMSIYEKHHLKIIHDWKSPEESFWDSLQNMLSLAMTPLSLLMEKAMGIPGVGPACQKAMVGALEIVNDIAKYSISKDSYVNAYQKAGHTSVETITDVYQLDLNVPDGLIAGIGAKYRALAFAQGAAAGLAGLPGLLVDTPALMMLAFRAIAEHAIWYGFDPESPEERLFAMNILAYSSAGSAEKQVILANLIKIAQDVARRQTWKELEKHALVAALKKLAQMVGIRLTKQKLAAAIPVIGAAFAGGFNTNYIANVSDAAYYLYRERFLAAKYGVDIIEITVPPARNPLENPLDTIDEGEDDEAIGGLLA